MNTSRKIYNEETIDFVKEFIDETSNLEVYEFRDGEFVRSNDNTVFDSIKDSYNTIGYCEGIFIDTDEFDDILNYLSDETTESISSKRNIKVDLPVNISIQNFAAMDVYLGYMLKCLNIYLREFLLSIGYDIDLFENLDFIRNYTGFYNNKSYILKQDVVNLDLAISFKINVDPTRIYLEEDPTRTSIRLYENSSKHDSSFKLLDRYCDMVNYDFMISVGQKSYSTKVTSFEELNTLLKTNIEYITTKCIDSSL